MSAKNIIRPAIGVGVLVWRDKQLLLGKRLADQQDICWQFPGGHLENNESVIECAVREVQEETGLKVELGEVFAVLSNFHDPDQHTIGIWYRGREVGGQLCPGGDLLDAAFFPLEELPELSFPTDRQVIAQLERRTVY